MAFALDELSIELMSMNLNHPECASERSGVNIRYIILTPANGAVQCPPDSELPRWREYTEKRFEATRGWRICWRGYMSSAFVST
eukprot:scaffold5755_cov143-Skeletonema_marinoi.AAC.3